MLDTTSGQNIFSRKDGDASDLFFNYIAGLEKYIAPATLLFAPHVNSYRRLSRFMSAPTNVHWGYDNRTCGIRIPNSAPLNRRVENRVPGVDVNPYLAMAATLACGYLGMVEGMKPSAPTSGSAEHVHDQLPRNLEDAIVRLRSLPGQLKTLEARIVATPQIIECDKVTGEDCYIARLLLRNMAMCFDHYLHTPGPARPADTATPRFSRAI